MLNSRELGVLNPNNDVSYYALHCPPPLKNRDFVLQRSWLQTPQEVLKLFPQLSPLIAQCHKRSWLIEPTLLRRIFSQYYIINHSVHHRDYPNQKGFIRGVSHLTGDGPSLSIPRTDYLHLARVPGDAPGPELLHPGLRGPLGPRGPASQLGDQQTVLHPGPQDGQADPQGLSQLRSLEGKHCSSACMRRFHNITLIAAQQSRTQALAVS